MQSAFGSDIASGKLWLQIFESRNDIVNGFYLKLQQYKRS